jgi:hypothetical protein
MHQTLATQCKISGCDVRCQGPNGEESLSLTDLYRTAGSPLNKEPGQWLRLPDTQHFVEFQCTLLNMGKAHIIQARKGRYGGTWAHWVVGIKYAAYLNKQLENDVIRAWRQLKTEERDPDLAADMSFQRVKNFYIDQRGYDECAAEEIAAERLMSKVVRNLLTREWKRRGARARDYGHLTNAGYLGLFKQTAADMRVTRGLPPKTNMRDHLTLSELVQTCLHEVLTRDRLRKDNLRGAHDMSNLSHDIGKQLSPVLDEIREPEKVPFNHPRPQRGRRSLRP